METAVVPQSIIQPSQNIMVNKIQNNEGYHQLHLYPETRSQQYSIGEPLVDLTNFQETFMLPVGNKTYLLDSCYLQIQCALAAKIYNFSSEKYITTNGEQNVYFNQIVLGKDVCYEKAQDSCGNNIYYPKSEYTYDDSSKTYKERDDKVEEHLCVRYMTQTKQREYGYQVVLRNQVWYLENSANQFALHTSNSDELEDSLDLPNDRVSIPIATGPKNSMVFLDRSRIQVQNQTPKEDIYIWRYQGLQIMNLDENQKNNPETWFTGDQNVITLNTSGNPQYCFFKIPLRYISTFFDSKNSDMLYTQYTTDPIQISLWFHSNLKKLLGDELMFYDDISMDNVKTCGITGLEMQLYYTENQDMTMAVQQQQQFVNVLPRYDREQLYLDSQRELNINLPSALVNQMNDMFFAQSVQDDGNRDSSWLHQTYSILSGNVITGKMKYYLEGARKNIGQYGFYQMTIDIGSGNQLQDRAGYQELIHLDADQKRFLNVDKLTTHKQLYDNSQQYNLLFNSFLYHSFRLLSLRKHAIQGDMNLSNLDVHLITQIGDYNIYNGTQKQADAQDLQDDRVGQDGQIIVECYAMKNQYCIYGQNGTQFVDTPQFLQGQQQ